MRVLNSVRNAIFGVVSQLLVVVIGFMTQHIFIKYLGIQYTGVAGVLGNVISMLSLAELGIGTAMIYSLYKPLAVNDNNKVRALMDLYQKSYRYIAIFVAIVGLIIMPFTSLFFKELTVNVNIHLIYFIFLIEAVSSYFYSYKRSLLYADQKEYINKVVTLASTVVSNVLCVILIITTQNYYLYLLARLITKFLENMYAAHVVNKKYPYLKQKCYDKIDKDEKRVIINNIKALMIHKIGSFVVLSTDNIIMSSMVSVTSAGIFVNYTLITKNLSMINTTIFQAITASFGNLLSTDKKKSYGIFKKMLFVNFLIATVTSACLLTLMNPFMVVFAGEKNVFGKHVECIIVLLYYIQCMRASMGVAKEAAGLYKQDQYIPLVESFINIVCSILFIKWFGVVGVMLGTLVSTLLTIYISVPYITFKHIYEISVIHYYKRFLLYTVVAVVACVVSVLIGDLVIINNIVMCILIKGTLTVATCIAVISVFCYRSEEYQYCLSILNHVLKKRRNKNSMPLKEVGDNEI